jgi:HPr kinase/phosphorylase
MNHETITVKRFFNEYAEKLELRLIAGQAGLSQVIREPTVNRPGLALAGFTKYFAHKRVQVIGNAEVYFLRSLTPEKQETTFKNFFEFKIPCVVISRGLTPPKRFIELANEHAVPVFKCPMATFRFIQKATLALETLFAPRGTELGSMVDILGVGVLIRGESGIGKSECVLALIERGYSLVADDVTRVTLVDGQEVVGKSADLARNHMEVRGIGIINVQAMFGVKSIRSEKRLDLVVSLVPWEKVQDIDRLGMEENYTTILGVKIPHITIPVRPGRDLARLVEVAAFQTKLRSIGYNAAEELNQRLIAKMNPHTKQPPEGAAD